jgi:carbon starvation protein
MLQDMAKHVWEPLGRTSWYPAVYASSAIFVGMWGCFLIGGVTDPLGGIRSLWPLFGISNQLLACVALCVATTIIVKMGKARYMWVTALPLLWVGVVTLTAGTQVVFSSNTTLGFLAKARLFSETLARGELPGGAATIEAAQRMIFNARLDAAVALFFMASVIVIIAASAREWIAVISGRKPAVSTEVPFTPRVQPAYGGDD